MVEILRSLQPRREEKDTLYLRKNEDINEQKFNSGSISQENYRLKKKLSSGKIPNNKERSNETYPINLSSEIYVDRNDVRDTDSKDFFGMCPQKTVRLKYGPVIQVSPEKFKKDDAGNIIEIKARIIEDQNAKPKGVLSWVSAKDAVTVEVRNYEHLFLVPNPDPEKYYEQLNPNSLKVYANAKVNKCLVNNGLQAPNRFQFERLGYYTVDYDTDNEKGKYVFNLTVGLVDNAKKKMAN